MTAATVNYTKAVIGQDSFWGPVRAFCTAGALNGLWACDTHRVDRFLNNREMVFHIDDSETDCLIVWRCRECGQPHGFTAS